MESKESTLTKYQTLRCRPNQAYDKKEYQCEELYFNFSTMNENLLVKEIPESNSSKSINHQHDEQHKNIISQLLNSFGVSNRYHDSTRPRHFACISNLRIKNVPDYVKVPRLRLLDLLTCSYENLEIEIIDHEYNSKTFSVTWPYCLDKDKLQKKHQYECQYGHNIRCHSPFFYPTLIIGIILRLLKQSYRNPTNLLIDDQSYIERFMWSFGQYPTLEITVYLHHPSKESDYNFQSKMSEITLSSILYKDRIDDSSLHSDSKKLSTFDKQLPSGWFINGYSFHAEKQMKKRINVQADLTFGAQNNNDILKTHKIATHQVFYRDIHIPHHKLNNLYENPEDFFDYVNLPPSDNSNWCFSKDYEPLTIQRFNENIHHWVTNESLHIYSTKGKLLVKDIDDSYDVIEHVEDDEFTMFMGSPSTDSPIFLDKPDRSLSNNYFHPSFTVKTTETKGFFFVYRFIHINIDGIRLYDIGVTVDVFNLNDDLVIQCPEGKNFPISQKTFASIVKCIEEGFQKKLNLGGYFNFPNKNQNPKYWVWTAKTVYPQPIDQKLKELNSLIDVPFCTITGYFNGVSNF